MTKPTAPRTAQRSWRWTRSVYDVSGRRVLRVDPNGTKAVYYGSMEVRWVPPVAAGAAGVTQVARYYPSMVRTFEGKLTFTVGGPQGSVSGSFDGTNVTRTLFSPYGAVRSGGAVNDKAFRGQTKDSSSGLNYLNARYQDPTIGIFLSVDPLVTSTFRPYDYANNNPISGSDPTGLHCKSTGECSGTPPVVSGDGMGSSGRALDFDIAKWLTQSGWSGTGWKGLARGFRFGRDAKPQFGIFINEEEARWYLERIAVRESIYADAISEDEEETLVEAMAACRGMQNCGFAAVTRLPDRVITSQSYDPFQLPGWTQSFGFNAIGALGGPSLTAVASQAAKLGAKKAAVGAKTAGVGLVVTEVAVILAQATEKVFYPSDEVTNVEYQMMFRVTYLSPSLEVLGGMTYAGDLRDEDSYVPFNEISMTATVFGTDLMGVFE